VAYGSGTTALTISSNEDWTGATLPSDANGGFLQYSSITVNPGVTWTIPSGLTFLSTGTVTINGTISVAQTPASPSGYGIVVGHAATSALWCVSATFCETSSTQSKTTLASLLYPGPFGGGQGYPESINLGGIAGAGGGSLVIRAAGAITIGSGGKILADGGNGIGAYSSGASSSSGSGGGAGGIVILASQTSVVNSGTVSAAGGIGGNGYYAGSSSGYAYSGGGGGGGGLIHLLAPAVTPGTTNIAGGAAGANSPSGITAGAYGAMGGSGGAMGGAGGVSSYIGNTASAAGSAGLLFQSPLDPTSLFTH